MERSGIAVRRSAWFDLPLLLRMGCLQGLIGLKCIPFCFKKL